MALSDTTDFARVPCRMEQATPFSCHRSSPFENNYSVG